MIPAAGLKSHQTAGTPETHREARAKETSPASLGAAGFTTFLRSLLAGRIGGVIQQADSEMRTLLEDDRLPTRFEILCSYEVPPLARRILWNVNFLLERDSSFTRPQKGVRLSNTSLKVTFSCP